MNPIDNTHVQKSKKRRRTNRVSFASSKDNSSFLVHSTQEDRDNADISYNIAKETGAAQSEAQARSSRDAAVSGIFSGLGNIAGGAIGAGM